MEESTGHCLCRRCSFAFQGKPNWSGYCHCESCRRQTASPVTAYLGVSHGHWRWTGEVPQRFASSPGVIRHFCGTCGAPMAFEGDRWPNEIHFFAALLDDPGRFAPTAHYHFSEHLPWFQPGDALPRKG